MRFFEVNDEKGYATPVTSDPEVQMCGEVNGWWRGVE